MSALRKRLAKLLATIAGDKRALTVAQHRWLMNHVKAVACHRASEKSQRIAQRLLTFGPDEDQAKGEAELRRSKRQSIRAHRAHERATWWVDRAKELTQSIHNLSGAAVATHKELREIGVQVNIPANKVSGGTARQRLAVAMHVSMAHSREYYSQTGAWSARYALTGPPSESFRFDCSSWFTSIYWTAGLPDPNANGYQGGYTGTLGEHGEPVISEGQLDSGDAILFGYAPFRHVEMKDGPMSKGPWTGGHGSSAVDRGTVTLLPGPRSFRRYV